MIKHMPLNKPIRLKMPGDPNKYHPIGKNDINDTISINIVFCLIDTITPRKHKASINIPGAVIIFDVFSLEWGF